MNTFQKFLTVFLVAVFALSSISVYQTAFAQNDPGNDDFVGNEEMNDSDDDDDMDSDDSDMDMDSEDDMDTTNSGIAVPTSLPNTGVSLK